MSIAFALNRAIHALVSVVLCRHRVVNRSQMHSEPTSPSEVVILSTEPGPITNVPVEILIEIFEQVKYIQSRCAESPLPIAVLLSHVTGQWREIILGAPTMWSTIAIYENGYHDLLRACLTRSKGCLLDVTVTGGLSDTEDDAFELIVPEIGRLRRLVIETYEEMRLLTIIQFLSDVSAPVLQQLHIYHDVTGQVGEFWERNNILAGGAPRLASVSLYGIGLGCCLPPLSAVTSLALGPTVGMEEFEDVMVLPSYEEFRRALAAFTGLTKLVLSKMVFDATPDDHPTLLEIPTILSLTVSLPCNEGPLYTSLLFFTIYTPALQTLTLSCSYDLHMPVCIANFKDGKEYPNLRSINFVEVDGMEYITEDFMRRSPNVTHLAFGATSYNQTLGLLCNQSDMLWPNLQSVSVTYFDNKLLRDIVLSGRPLDTLCIRSARQIPTDEMAWMRAHVQVELP